MSSKKHPRKQTGLNLIAPDHYRNFETVITRNATEYSVRSFEDGVEIFYIDLTKHPVADWIKVTETLCLMHHISGPMRKPHVNGRKHRRPTQMAVRKEEGGKKVYDFTEVPEGIVGNKARGAIADDYGASPGEEFARAVEALADYAEEQGL